MITGQAASAVESSNASSPEDQLQVFASVNKSIAARDNRASCERCCVFGRGCS
jgi:hypothetical protein